MKRPSPIALIRMLAFVGLLVAGFGAAGQPPATTPPADRSLRPHWTVNHGEVYCSLSRYNGPAATTFSIRTIPGTSRVELLFSSSAWRRSPVPYGTTLDVMLLPGNSKHRVDARTGRLPNNAPLLAFLDLQPDFVDAVAAASRMQLMRGQRTILAVDLPQAGRAVQTLRECHDRTLTDWGVDLALGATLRSYPVLVNRPLSSGDYPSAAISANAQGLVVVGLAVGADGRVSDCRVLRSSSNRALDDRSCREFRSEGRFSPAIGADGRPVAFTVVQTVVWRIAG